MIRNKELRKKGIFMLFTLLSVQLIAQDPPDLSLIFYLDENSKAGTLVGTVKATDPDGDQLTYTITSGNEAGAFAISSTSGDITVNNEDLLDFDVTPSFALMVEANDGKGGVMVAAITINLNDIPLGFENHKELLTVFPNPTSKVLFVEFAGVLSHLDEIAMYSMEGRQISVSLQPVSNTKVEIDLGELNEGIYLLKIAKENGHYFQQRIFKTN
ncbi:MAG: cadherin domain-containing protein [Cyclobacteriaceae bacterium]